MIITAKPGTVTVIPATVQQPKAGQPDGKKLRVAAYCRVSSEKDEQLNSFEVQVNYYTEKIAQNPEWKMAGIFADEGISGTSLKNRDEFKRMLRHCREGRIDLILVKSVSRFGRNTVDVMDTVRKLLKRNIGVKFEKENLDTRDMSSEMMLAFHSAFSQSESESIRGNILSRFRIYVDKRYQRTGLPSDFCLYADYHHYGAVGKFDFGDRIRSH